MTRQFTTCLMRTPYTDTEADNNKATAGLTMQAILIAYAKANHGGAASITFAQAKALCQFNDPKLNLGQAYL